MGASKAQAVSAGMSLGNKAKPHIEWVSGYEFIVAKTCSEKTFKYVKRLKRDLDRSDQVFLTQGSYILLMATCKKVRAILNQRGANEPAKRDV